ncbi:MAG: S8 family serine peptidase [Thermoplasmata archaeon]|jgi:hypothetical protein|nr:S8 family serine peptidase [Thermoplasmata archaeon]
MISCKRACLSLLLMLCVVGTSFVVLATPASAQTSAYTGSTGTDAALVGETVEQETYLTPEMKIDSVTRSAMKTATGDILVYVFVSDKAAANEFLASAGLPTIGKKEFEGLSTIQLMSLDAKEIELLAEEPSVSRIMIYEKPLPDSASLDEAIDNSIEAAPPATDDYDVDVVHTATDAWDAGWTGDGVTVAVVDTGFDMAHPDLQGQQARYTSGNYSGWPMAYDDVGAMMWAYGEIGGWIADTRTTVEEYGSYVYFDGFRYNVEGLTDAIGDPVDSQSGWYHIGYHTDSNLASLWGEYVAVLVVDAVNPYEYDTVYVDLDNDNDFADEKACTQGDEISYYDFYDSVAGTEDWSSWDAGDGFADLSGGMIYWISDGEHWYPGVNWTYGSENVFESGDAVAFVGEFTAGESHGTMTASAALAQGVTMDGLLGGMAPDAKLMAIPNNGDVTNCWMFAEFGPDGLTNTGDEAQVVSNSYGWSDTAIEAGYGDFDLAATAIDLEGYETLWVWSAGNGGPGYGTTHAVTDFASVHVGAGTTMQYRYWVGYEWDSTYSKWGDVIPFSNAGPTKTGKLNAEIVASGAYSMEPMPLNQYDYFGTFGDGSMHFQLGSGTSHAAPTVAGGAALGLQAFHDTSGGWPSIDQTKTFLMAASDDMHNDPLRQGAGWLNANRFCDFMSYADGVISYTPPFWTEPVFGKAALYPGDVYGTKYEMFPNFIYPGEYDDQMMVLTSSYDPAVIHDVAISAEMLMRQDSDALELTTTGSDIYLDITDYVPTTTDLLKVTVYWDYYVFDVDGDYVTDASYWLEAHDWVDENGDGEINHSSGAGWELYRFTVDGEDNNYDQITIKDPRDRITDGLVLRVRDWTGVEGNLLNVQLDYYELETFDWVQFRTWMSGDPWTSTLGFTLDPAGTTDWMWEVNVSVPADAPIGTYAAAIYIDDGERRQCLPMVINVPAMEFEFEFGGESYFDTTYNNDVTGLADKAWRFEVGDWRTYWCLPDPAAPIDVEATMMVQVNWTELPTDTNIHVIAALPSFIYDDGWVLEPPFGPGFTEVAVASSDEKYLGAGTFGVYTTTGGPSEVIGVPNDATEWGSAGISIGFAQLIGWIYLGLPAPFAIETRTPTMAGTSPSDTLDGYTKLVTVGDFAPSEVYLESIQPGDPAEIGYVPLSGSIPAEYTIDLLGEIEVRGGGIAPVAGQEWPSEEIYQDSLAGSFYEALANAVYTRAIEVGDTSSLRVAVEEVSDCPDIDLGLWYDEDLDGVADLTETFWYVGAGGSTEALTLEDPEPGQYLVKVLGYSVSGSPGYFSLTVQTAIPDAMIEAADFDTPVAAGTYAFNITYDLPAIAGVYSGYATMGLMGAADTFSIPVTIDVIDAGAPAIENVVPSDAEALASGAVMVEFDVNDTVEFYSGLDESSLVVEIDGTDWTEFATVAMGHVAVVAPFTFGEGEHTLHIEAADLYGNPAEAYDGTFTVDSVIEDFSAMFMDPVLPVAYDDGTTVPLATISIHGTTDPLATVDITSAGGSANVDADDTGTFDAAMDLVEGANVFTLVTTNPAGVSATMYKTITADWTCALDVDPVDALTGDDVVTLSGRTEAGAMVTVDGDPANVDADGSWSYDASLSEGANTLTVEAEDAVGNMASAEVAIRLDTTAPTITISAPDDDATVAEASVAFEGSVSEDAMVFVNGVLAGDMVTSWSATVVLQEGANTVVVMALDEVGNMATVTQSVTYEPPYATPDDLDGLQDDIEDQIDGLNQTTQEDIDDVSTRVDDADSFAQMLLYLNVGLFLVAVVLIVMVWYLLGKRGGGNPGRKGGSLEQVDDPPSPSDVEKEFASLEKEIGK